MTEELRWGSPTATPPFEPLDFAPKDEYYRRLHFRLGLMCFVSAANSSASAYSSFRGKFSASAYFRVIPWQILLLILPSVANLLLRNPCIIKELQYKWPFAIRRV